MRKFGYVLLFLLMVACSSDDTSNPEESADDYYYMVYDDFFGFSFYGNETRELKKRVNVGLSPYYSKERFFPESGNFYFWNKNISSLYTINLSEIQSASDGELIDLEQINFDLQEEESLFAMVFDSDETPYAIIKTEDLWEEDVHDIRKVESDGSLTMVYEFGFDIGYWSEIHNIPETNEFFIAATGYISDWLFLGRFNLSTNQYTPEDVGYNYKIINELGYFDNKYHYITADNGVFYVQTSSSGIFGSSMPIDRRFSSNNKFGYDHHLGKVCYMSQKNIEGYTSTPNQIGIINNDGTYEEHTISPMQYPGNSEIYIIEDLGSD